MTTLDSSDRWFILTSADAMAGRSYSTDEIVDAYQRGALGDRIVVYHRFGNRREGMTVKDLVAKVKNAKKK